MVVLTRCSAAPREAARSAMTSCSRTAKPPSGLTALMRSRLSRRVISASVRCAGLEGEGVQLAAHIALKGLINKLMLLHPRLATERLGDDAGRVMVAVAGEVADLDFGVGKGGLDEAFDFGGIHCHEGLRFLCVS